MVKKLSLLLFSIFLNSTAYAAVIATVDRSEIAINESFTLRYESSDEEKRTPDFSPINKDFDIVGQNRETSLNIINGKSSQKTIFNLSLIAKRTGTLTIPEIQFSKSSSASIIINVKKQLDRSNDKDIELSVSVDKKNAYIQEQILLTVKLARAINAQQESISDLKFSHEDLIIEPLTNDYKQYETMLNGRRHIVYERQYAVFPQKAGPVTLAPINYNAVIPDQQQRRRSFFDDPFFNRSGGKRIREQSQAITLDIKPKPDSFIGEHWLPANKVELSVDFSDNINNLKIGDSLTRTITIKADQQLASTLPELADNTVENAKTYPDQANTNQQKAKYGIYSQRIERTAVVPTDAGNIRFPEIQIAWWNTRTKQKELLTVPAKTINVKAGLNNSISDNAANNTTITTDSVSGKWFYLALLGFMGWFLTVIVWLYFAVFKNRVISKKVSGSKQAILDACKNNNAPAAKAALIAWAQEIWPEKNITNLGAISNIVNDDTLTRALNNLQKNLYGQSAEKWNNKLLIKSIKNLQTNTVAEKHDKHLLFNIR